MSNPQEAIKSAVRYIKEVSYATLGEGERDFSDFDLLDRVENAYEVVEDMCAALREAQNFIQGFISGEASETNEYLKEVLAKLEAE